MKKETKKTVEKVVISKEEYEEFIKYKKNLLDHMLMVVRLNNENIELEEENIKLRTILSNHNSKWYNRKIKF